MDLEDVERIGLGMKHCVMGNGLSLKCLKCKTEYKPNIPPGGVPLWFTQGLAWGFSHEHSDCEEEEVERE